MKINRSSISDVNGSTAPLVANGKANGSATTSSITSTAPGSSAEAISLSSASMALHAAQGATAPFDAAKVESIKSAISSGTFQINPGAIADGLISSVTELLGKK